jgi:hypothetical protein
MRGARLRWRRSATITNLDERRPQPMPPIEKRLAALQEATYLQLLGHVIAALGPDEARQLRPALIGSVGDLDGRCLVREAVRLRMRDEDASEVLAAVLARGELLERLIYDDEAVADQ